MLLNTKGGEKVVIRLKERERKGVPVSPTRLFSRRLSFVGPVFPLGQRLVASAHGPRCRAFAEPASRGHAVLALLLPRAAKSSLFPSWKLHLSGQEVRFVSGADPDGKNERRPPPQRGSLRCFLSEWPSGDRTAAVPGEHAALASQSCGVSPAWSRGCSYLHVHVRRPRTFTAFMNIPACVRSWRHVVLLPRRKTRGEGVK